MSVLAAAPIILPLLGSVAMFASMPWPRLQRSLGLGFGIAVSLSAALLFFETRARGIVVHSLSDWPAPYGIILVADLLSATLVAFTAGIFLAALVYSLGYIDAESLRGSYLALFFFLATGVNGAFLTGDAFNLFVFFELMLISIYGLVITQDPEGLTTRAEKLEAVFKYLVLNLIGTAMMLLSIGALYGTVGTLNMADLSVKVQILRDTGVRHLDFVALLFVGVFGLKAATAPFHFWLPDVHPSAPTPVSALLSGILIKVGAYGLIRLTTLLFPGFDGLREILLIVALGTLLLGGALAIGQVDVKRLLAYSSISQMGFLLLGVGIGGAQGIAAAVFFLVNHAIVKSMLFLAAGGVIHATHVRSLEGMGGLARTSPFLAGSFLVGALALAGIPPTNGFVGKLLVFQALVDARRLEVVAIALVGAFLSILYALRAWLGIFWGEGEPAERSGVRATAALPIGVLAALCLIFGILADPLVGLANDLGAQVADPTIYVNAVLGGSGS